MSVKGKVKRANKRIAELEKKLILKEDLIQTLESNYKKEILKIEKRAKEKEDILKQLVIRECGLRGGINLMIDSIVNDVEMIIDEEKFISPDIYARNQKCYTIRIHPKWR